MLLLNLRLWADDGMYDDTALVEHFLDVQLTRRDLSCMRHIKHLNDEALNFYFKVLQDTITRDNGEYVHVMKRINSIYTNVYLSIMV